MIIGLNPKQLTITEESIKTLTLKQTHNDTD